MHLGAIIITINITSPSGDERITVIISIYHPVKRAIFAFLYGKVVFN
jgi:hypothetical protein